MLLAFIESKPLVVERTNMTQETGAPRAGKARRRMVAIAVLVVLAVLAAVVSQYPPLWGLPKRFKVVDEGVLYRSAQPKTHQIDNVMEECGIRSILIVREGSSRKVPDEVEHAQKRGLQVLKIPIKSRQPVPDDEVRQFFEYVDNPENRPMLIHCSAGRHRTGYLCAMYRIERQGWTVDRAVEEMLSFGFNEESQSAVLVQLKSYSPGRFALPTTSQAGVSDSDAGQQP